MLLLERLNSIKGQLHNELGKSVMNTTTELEKRVDKSISSMNDMLVDLGKAKHPGDKTGKSL